MSETLKFKNCPNCKKLLSQDDYPRFCPACGQDLIIAARDLERILARTPESVQVPAKHSFPWFWLLAIGLIVFVVIIALSPSRVSVVNSPTSASKIIPSTPLPINMDARATSNAMTFTPPIQTEFATNWLSPVCLRWDQVTVDMNGQTKCVYGIIKSLSGTRYNFSDSPNTFFLYSEYEIQSTVTGKTLAPGECVRLTDAIRIEKDVPYIDADDLIKNHIYQNFKSSDNTTDCP